MSDWLHAMSRGLVVAVARPLLDQHDDAGTPTSVIAALSAHTQCPMAVSGTVTNMSCSPGNEDSHTLRERRTQ